MSIGSNLSHSPPLGRAADARIYHCAPDDDPGGPTRKAARSNRPSTAEEDLPYKVELWNESRTSVELVLAVTASGSIGYAAYYAATREYPDRYVTLRHKNNIVSRSNPPQH
jgi:hypothetical protein